MTPSNVVELDVPLYPLEIELSAPIAALVPEGLGKLSVTAVAREWRGHGPFNNGTIHDAGAYEWMLDDVFVGCGKKIQIDPPPLGLHTLTVEVKWNNQEARASIAFEMTDQLLGQVESMRAQIRAMRELFPHIAWNPPTALRHRSAASRLWKFLRDRLSRRSRW